MIEPLATLAAAPAAAGAATRHVSFTENLEFLFVGLLIVMGTLAALWILCELLGSVFKLLAARQAARAACEAPPLEAPVAGPGPDAVPIVVIAAAVAAVLEQPHRVVEIRPASIAWSLEGRRQQLGSHKLPR